MINLIIERIKIKMQKINDLIKEIENNLTSSDTDIVECLKKARIVARHFNDLEILTWIDNELKGYESDHNFPDYRKIPASFYQTKIEQYPLGLGQIFRRKSNEIIDTFTFAYTANIEEIVLNSKQDNVKLVSFIEEIKAEARIIISRSALIGIIMEVNLKLLDYIHEKSKIISQIPYENPLMKIFNKFHLIAKQLEERYNNRQTIKIEDEYDVQDLLHGLLHLEFDSIQKEEYGSQFAGKRPRVDFFLRFENVAIEVKKIRNKNHAKTVREEIIIDKEYYGNNIRISDLYFFIYDPDSLIINRVDFIEDLTKNIPKQFNTFKIIIKPDI